MFIKLHELSQSSTINGLEFKQKLVLNTTYISKILPGKKLPQSVTDKIRSIYTNTSSAIKLNASVIIMNICGEQSSLIVAEDMDYLYNILSEDK